MMNNFEKYVQVKEVKSRVLELSILVTNISKTCDEYIDVKDTIKLVWNSLDKIDKELMRSLDD